jgi:hypothetical protein
MKSFDTLSLYEKGNLLKSKAEYLATTIYYHYAVRLYSFDSLFIEEYYDKDQDEVIRINIAVGADMDKHTSGIILTDLVSPKNFPPL